MEEIRRENIINPSCHRPSHSQKDIEYLQKLKDGISLNDIEIKPSKIEGAGTGVFARRRFEPFDVIEYCHVIVFEWREKQLQDISVTKYAYSYSCDCSKCRWDGRKMAMPLGFGAIYNSALTKEEANCEHYVNIHTPVQIFYAVKPIEAGEEILTYYGDAYVNAFLKRKK